VTALGAILFVAVCLGLQVLVTTLLPGAGEYVDFLIVPVVWFGIRRSQKAAMLTGCMAGLARDAWFRSAAFGMSGFEKTFLGWFLGGLSSRFDLNSPISRFTTGFVFAQAQNLLTIGLLRLMDQVTVPPRLGHWLVQGLVSGLLVVIGFAIVNRIAGEDETGSGYSSH
jgi:rod shape-determining protein MreD